MNIDFANEPGFSTYVVLLAVAGITTVFFGTPVFGRASRGLRLFNLVVGIGFIGYAFYLAFIFQGGTYVLFFKAFVLPVILIFRTVMSMRRSSGTPVASYPSSATGTVAPPSAQPGYTQPGPAQAQGYPYAAEAAPTE